MSDMNSVRDRLSVFKLTRRAMIGRAAALGVSATALSALLAACGSSNSNSTTAASSSTGSSSGSSATTSSSSSSSSTASSSSSAGSSNETPKKGGTFVFGAWQDADTLDPHTTGLAATSRILIQIYDALVWSNPEDKKLYPGLAQKWEVSTDGKEYTFNLRQDVKFHNGEAFTSDSVKFGNDRIVNPDTKSLGRSSLGPYNRTETPDKYTAKVIFDQPFTPFLTYVSVTLGLRPVSPKAYQDLGTNIN